MSTIKVDTVRPVTTDGSLSLKGDSGGSATTNGISVDSSGDTSISGDLKFNSGYGSAATAYGCRAWVNFDGTTGSGTGSSDITILGSGNVSSITDNGNGDYIVNFANNMPDANFSAVVSAFQSGSVLVARTPIAQSTSSYRIIITSTVVVDTDASSVATAVFR